MAWIDNSGFSQLDQSVEQRKTADQEKFIKVVVHPQSFFQLYNKVYALNLPEKQKIRKNIKQKNKKKLLTKENTCGNLTKLSSRQCRIKTTFEKKIKNLKKVVDKSKNL